MILEKKATHYIFPSDRFVGAEQCVMNKPYSKHAPAEGERNLGAGTVTLYTCVHLSHRAVLWTLRRTLWPGWLSEFHFLPSSCPRKITLQPCTLVSAFVPSSLPTTLWQSKFWAVLQNKTEHHRLLKSCLGTNLPSFVLMLYLLLPLQHLAHTKLHVLLHLPLFLTLLLFVSNLSLSTVTGTKYTVINVRWTNGGGW